MRNVKIGGINRKFHNSALNVAASNTAQRFSASANNTTASRYTNEIAS